MKKSLFAILIVFFSACTSKNSTVHDSYGEITDSANNDSLSLSDDFVAEEEEADNFIQEADDFTEIDENTDEDNSNNSQNIDSDHDGLSDKKEKELGTDPTLRDTDGDGYDDLEEIVAGSDPLDPDDGIPQDDSKYYVVLPYDADDNVLRMLNFTNSDIELDVWATTVSIENSLNVDTSEFVKSIIPYSSEPVDSYESKDKTTFYAVDPRTEVNFEITFHNGICQSSESEETIFKANINIIGDGDILDTREVIIIVPGTSIQ